MTLFTNHLKNSRKLYFILCFSNKGKDYVDSAEEMIRKNIRVNNEFYVCPVYNQGIEKGKKFIINEIDKMWGIGTPEDLENFLREYG